MLQSNKRMISEANTHFYFLKKGNVIVEAEQYWILNRFASKFRNISSSSSDALYKGV